MSPLLLSETSDLNGYPGTRTLNIYPNLKSHTRVPKLLSISPTLAYRVQTYLNFINSPKNETIYLKCTRVMFSHPYTPFIVFYLSFILVVYALSNADTL